MKSNSFRGIYGTTSTTADYRRGFDYKAAPLHPMPPPAQGIPFAPEGAPIKIGSDKNKTAVKE
jgi:hypothetical protein